MALTNAEKAWALARIGFKVFPVNASDKSPMRGTRGFFDATDDAGQIDLWFNYDYAEDATEVAYWTGGSGAFVLDVDKKSGGKDGFASIKSRGLSVGTTYAYPTKNGGQHRVFLSDRVDLTLSKDFDGLEGVDIRAGGSYAVWWGDTVPDKREAFSTEIPEWMTAVPASAEFTGTGFDGTIEAWLESLPDDVLPSGRVREFMERVPVEDFGHPEMTDLAWELVRLGSERETGIVTALAKLQKAWLRDEYDIPKYRRDLKVALLGAINKAGRLQEPKPTIMDKNSALNAADQAGVKTDLARIERAVSETATEAELSGFRREIFKIAADAGLSQTAALGVVFASKAVRFSKAGADSIWYSDGEPLFQAREAARALAATTAEAVEAADSEELERKVAGFAAEAAEFSFLTEGEITRARTYNWWGNDYLTFAQSRLEHFNRPYHVATMWAALSVIASPWGKVKNQGGKPIDCNLYLTSLGVSTSGKSEAWGFGTDMIDAVYGTENSPILGDISKLTSLALHRALVTSEGAPALVYGDEVQSFFQGVSTTQWQNGILGDLSSHYGGDVAPKLTLNDKEISGKRGKTILTTFLTGIDTQMLAAIDINHWKNGFFYRFLWSFGEPRRPTSYTINFASPSTVDYAKQMDLWAHEFRRVQAHQAMIWGEAREVDWSGPAKKRMEKFFRDMDDAVIKEPLFEEIFVSANLRFRTSMMKAATLVALAEASEKVELDHVLVALDYAGAWHKSMVIAVSETGKESFERDVEKWWRWIKRNAVVQVGKPAWIQKTAVYRAVKPVETADRILRQLTEEGWLVKAGDKYELSEG